MKKSNVKIIALTLGIALVFAIAFFFVQYFIREVSLQISLIGGGSLFVLIGIAPICFYLIDKHIEKRDRKGNKCNKN